MQVTFDIDSCADFSHAQQLVDLLRYLHGEKKAIANVNSLGNYENLIEWLEDVRDELKKEIENHYKPALTSRSYPGFEQSVEPLFPKGMFGS